MALPLAPLGAITMAVILQATLLAGRLGGLTFDLVFLLTLVAARRWGAPSATLVGWWGGLLMGAFSGSLALPLALLYGLTGFAAGVYLDAVGEVGFVEGGALVLTLSLTLMLAEALFARPVLLPTLLTQLVLVTPLLVLLRRRT